MLRAAPTRIGRLLSEASVSGVRSGFTSWLRLWASAAAAVALISGLGILFAASTDLTAPMKSQAAEQPESGPPPIAAYDRDEGAAPAVRLNTPAQTRMVAVQRHYELATERQATTETGYQLLADDRHRALVDEAGRTVDNQTRIFAERQRQQVMAAGKAKLEELRRAATAAAAAAALRREQGLEPPADAGSVPSGSSGNGSSNGSGNGADPTITDPGGDQITSGGGALPIAAGTIGARFGAVGSWSSYHTGLDFVAGYGEPIHAAADGVVLFAGNTGDWAGNHVAVQHADGTTTMYSHMSWIGASVGEQVSAGQVIGRVGQTGRAFGPHLHFEVYPPGIRYGDVYKAVDPLPWLASIGVNPH